MNVCELNNELLKVYGDWLNELRQINDGKFLSDSYSNPYFISAPESWLNSKLKVMVVGKEGAGGGCGKGEWCKNPQQDMRKIIEYTTTYPQIQEKIITENFCGSTVNNSAFWRRFRNVYDMVGSPVIWNNFDKIHYMPQKGEKRSKCTLDNAERKLLHSTTTKILRKEIEILKPTHVIFFGWYKNFLGSELPELKENGLAIEEYKGQCFCDGVTYIISNHPTWGMFHPDYENFVLNLISESFKAEINKNF